MKAKTMLILKFNETTEAWEPYKKVLSGWDDVNWWCSRGYVCQHMI